MKHVTILGIPNCNTMKKPRDWLVDSAIEHRFHNYKKEGIDEAVLQSLLAHVAWDVLLNKRGTTWRKLEDKDKADINPTKAVQLMAANPSMIKRPVLVVEQAGEKEIRVGFTEGSYQELLLTATS